MPLPPQSLLLAGAALAIFAADLHIELGVVAAAPYVVVVSLAYAGRNVKWIWLTAGLCSLLTVIGFLLSPAGDEPWKSVANRALVLVAIWSPVIPAVRALEEISKREELAHIVEASSDAIVGATLDGIVTSWNRGAERLYGYSAEEMVGKPLDCLGIDPADAPSALFAGLEGAPQLEPVEAVAKHKNGRHVHVSLATFVVEDPGGPAGAAIIGRDIGKRKRMEAQQTRLNESVRRRSQELARANESLERSNRELHQFAFAASHDLQTPLRAIAGFAQFLESEYGDKLDDIGRDYVARIVSGTERLQRLISDLLRFSRIESRALPFGPVSLDELLEEVKRLLRESLDDSGGSVESAPLPTVSGDRTQLRQLVQNLIENAIKYSGDTPPRIRVAAKRDGEEWTISVSDNGIGIEPEYRERIFKIFQRLHTNNAYPGTGIGLALCRQIVHRHGGRIWAEEAEGGGSKFSFTLAAPAVPEEETQPTPDGVEQTVS